MAEDTVSGLTDDQLVEFEAQIEAAMTRALQQVMDQIADRLGAHQVGRSGPKAKP